MAKFNIRDLAAKPTRVILVHPVLGETDIYVDVVGPQSTKFKEALKDFEALSEKEQHEAQSNLLFLSRCVVGWDEDAFNEPYSAEAAARVFTTAENSWMAAFLTPIIQDSTKFFRKPD